MTTEPTARKNRMATVALVLAICGLPIPSAVFSALSWFRELFFSEGLSDFGIIASICMPLLPSFVAVFLALVARRQIKKAQGTLGKGKAITASIVGYVSIMSYATIALWIAFVHHR